MRHRRQGVDSGTKVFGDGEFTLGSHRRLPDVHSAIAARSGRSEIDGHAIGGHRGLALPRTRIHRRTEVARTRPTVTDTFCPIKIATAHPEIGIAHRVKQVLTIRRDALSPLVITRADGRSQNLTRQPRAFGRSGTAVQVLLVKAERADSLVVTRVLDREYQLLIIRSDGSQELVPIRIDQLSQVHQLISRGIFHRLNGKLAVGDNFLCFRKNI